MAKLYQSTARPAEAHAVLAPALEGFAPTPEMPELAEAQALLAALAETNEVKGAEAQRQRRLHLQTAYGQVMMYSKCFAADETKAAFARAAELAANSAAGGQVCLQERPSYLSVSGKQRGLLPRESPNCFVDCASTIGVILSLTSRLRWRLAKMRVA